MNERIIPPSVGAAWHDEGVRATSATLVGRSRELTALRTILADASEGRPRTVVLAGEAGIGKTRLLDEFGHDASGTSTVVLGQCVDLGVSALPYAAITGMLHDLIDQVGKDAVLDAAGPSRGALGVLLPELTAAEPSSAARLHEVVAVLLENLARKRPMVVVIEDLHWADGATLAVLRFLVRALSDSAVMLLLSYRSDDVHRGHPLRGFLAELERSRLTDRIELQRLTVDEVGELSQQILGSVPDPLELENVFERSDGVPFFVEELVCCSSDEFPDSLRDLLLARYERLSGEAQSLLRLLAAGGVSVRHTVLAAVAEGEIADLDGSAREAVLAQVITATDSNYTFRHALVREAIHAELLPGERLRFHGRYAEVLETTGAYACGSTEVATHWFAAQNRERAFSASLHAMTEATETYAYMTAAQMGESALDLWERIPDAAALAGISKVELLARTAAALRDAGDTERSLAMINLALEESVTRNDSAYALLLRDKAFYLANTGKAGSIALLEEALSMVPAGADDLVRASLLSQLASRLMIEGHHADSIIAATEALELSLRESALVQASVAANLRGVVRVHGGLIEEGLADLERAHEWAGDDGTALLRHSLNSSDAQFALGNYAQALAIAEAGIASARELGVERSTGMILSSNAVDPLFALGDWDRAETLLDRALAMSPPLVFTAYLRRAKLWSLLWHGETDAAASLYRGWRSQLTALTETDVQIKLSLARVAAEIALEQGDLDDAWNQVQVLTTDGEQRIVGYDLPLLGVAGRVLAARGASEEEIQPFRTVLAATSGWPTHELWAAVFEAELADDVASWQQVTELDGPAHIRPYARYRLGQALFNAGDRPGARHSLEQAAAEASALGARLITRRVNEFASRAGLSVTESRPANDPTELTAREQQVLELIAQGLSNKQIGEKLFISAKTASVHVSAILRKLGATSRTEAVFLAGQRVPG
jgi:ATP/maltotriose-dependent transcriptional regulator MalT